MPTRNQVVVKPVLSNIAIGYRNESSEYIASQVFPRVGVAREVGEYWKFGHEAYKRYRTRRAPNTNATVIDYLGTRSEYNCEEYALSAAIGKRERDNDSAPLSIERRKTTLVADAMLLDAECRMAELITATGNWANASPSTKWDAASATPITDVAEAREIVRKGSGGRRPNTLVLPQIVLNALEQSEAVLARLSTAALQITTLDVLRALFQVPRILVPGTLTDATAEGQTTTTLSDVWGDSVWLGYVAPTPSIDIPSAGYTFVQRDFRARMWRDEGPEIDYVELSLIQDEKIVCASCGYLLDNVLT